MTYCILVIVSLCGNSAIITVVWKVRRMRKTINFFIVNMCIADLLITLYMPRSISVSFTGYRWLVGGILGLIFCKFSVFMHQTAIAVSIFTVIAISCDRFFAVVFPLKTFITKKICQIIIAFTWILSAAIRLPMLYGLKVTVGKNGYLGCLLSLDDAFYKGAEKNYYQFTLIGLFAVPLSVIVILYSGIFISLRLRKSPGEVVPRGVGREHRRDAVITKKVLRMVFIVVVVFVLCWLLFFIQLILFSYKIRVPCEVLFWRLFLAHLNSGINPILYLVLNENYREGVKNLIRRWRPGGFVAEKTVYPLRSVTLESSRNPQMEGTQTKNNVKERYNSDLWTDGSVVFCWTEQLYWRVISSSCVHVAYKSGTTSYFSVLAWVTWLYVCFLVSVVRNISRSSQITLLSKLIDFYRYDVDSDVVNAAINAVIVKPRNNLKSFGRYEVALFLVILLSNFWLWCRTQKFCIFKTNHLSSLFVIIIRWLGQCLYHGILQSQFAIVIALVVPLLLRSQFEINFVLHFVVKKLL